MIPTPAPSTPRPGRSGEHGFTWSEFVLVVVFVVGLLTVAVLSVNGLRDDTRVTNCQNAKRALMTAAARYQAANDSYPVNKDVLIESGVVDEGDVRGWTLEFGAEATEPTYVPTDDCA